MIFQQSTSISASLRVDSPVISLTSPVAVGSASFLSSSKWSIRASLFRLFHIGSASFLSSSKWSIIRASLFRLFHILLLFGVLPFNACLGRVKTLMWMSITSLRTLQSDHVTGVSVWKEDGGLPRQTKGIQRRHRSTALNSEIFHPGRPIYLTGTRITRN
jgi:hypothetical protein